LTHKGDKQVTITAILGWAKFSESMGIFWGGRYFSCQPIIRALNPPGPLHTQYSPTLTAITKDIQTQLFISDDTSPITVHCGTGAGATGAFIGNL
jgi:hypothetical protein